MIYSSACEYAIRAASHLASRQAGNGEFVKLRDIAEAEGLPPAFLSSVLQRLVTAGILRSARGPTGGYALGRSADRVSLRDVMEVVDGDWDLQACAVGLGPCLGDGPCALHETWKPVREEIERYLTGTTLQDMAEALRRKRAGAAGSLPVSPARDGG